MIICSECAQPLITGAPRCEQCGAAVDGLHLAENDAASRVDVEVRAIEGERLRREAASKKRREQEARRLARQEAVRLEVEAQQRAEEQDQAGKVEAREGPVVNRAGDGPVLTKTESSHSLGSPTLPVDKVKARRKLQARGVSKEKARQSEEARLRVEAEERQRAEAEAARIREEKRIRIESEARHLAEGEAARAREEKRIREENEARQRADAEAARVREEERIRIENEARQRAEAEAARVREEKRIREENEARQLAEAEAARVREEERIRIENEARQRAEEEAARVREEKRIREKNEARKRAEEEAARVREEERIRAEAAERQRAEAERRHAEAEAARLREEDQRIVTAQTLYPTIPLETSNRQIAEADRSGEKVEGITSALNRNDVDTPLSNSGNGRDISINFSLFDELAPVPRARTFTVRIIIAVVAVFLLAGLIVGVSKFRSSERTVESKPISDPPTPAAPPGMIYIPRGKFEMGSDRDEYERPAHLESVEPFFIDVDEVTCEAYSQFVKANNYKRPPGWNGSTYPPGSARKPVTGVTWYDASAYAKWAGKRLPTEREWEYAARGEKGYRYPWGNEWKAGQANAEKAATGLSDVGSFQGVSPFGLRDMSGNAWEWTSTTIQAYPGGSIDESQLPKEPREEVKVLRGGCYLSSAVEATSTYRFPWAAKGKYSFDQAGFRCARDIK